MFMSMHKDMAPEEEMSADPFLTQITRRDCDDTIKWVEE
jgi:hypothetical protein